MKLYLAGKIPKGKELDSYIDWRDEYRKFFTIEIPEVEILDPDMSEFNGTVNEEDSEFWFGHDSWMIRESDVVIVKADKKMGVGTAQEILIAKYFSKPVIIVLPKDTHHRRSNFKLRSGIVEDWINPFIRPTTDLIVEKIDESVEWLREYLQNPKNKKIKEINTIDKAIEYFLEMTK